MVYYKIGPIKILYDVGRVNGRYFAGFTVQEYEDRASPLDEPKLRRTKTLEVILNGPGKNKALKKIRRQLYTTKKIEHPLLRIASKGDS